MAIIILDPGESFEHYHSESSETQHLEGELEVAYNKHTFSISNGEKITIPAATSHSLTNVGQNKASFLCRMHVTDPTPYPHDPPTPV